MKTEDRHCIVGKIQTALDRIDAAIRETKPTMVVGLYSGGHDSCSAVTIASLHDAFSGALHINTGIGVEATRDHVKAVASQRGWKLWEYKAIENTKADGTPDPMSYDDICRKHGFPGPAGVQVAVLAVGFND